ncbi:MAG TPA: glycosyltransferase family 4 protein [Ferrovibrio sp.]|uniref:glycosyltransferase family 4 protein n=1 Tax=Ferrovibrio sp. TaxID=1917215 RepID=UPI002ED4BBB8
MRILHLSTFDTDGGAARGSLWLHEALRRRNVDSALMVGSKRGDDPSVLRLPLLKRVAAKLRMRLDDLPLRRYEKTDESFWSVGWLPGRLDQAVKALAPDIIHLHWVGAGFLPIAALKHFHRPVVWTLRDMWSFTGGCHYTGGCDQYLEGCGACPQLNSDDPEDLSRRIWRQKQKHWRDADLWLVPISHWLGDCARQSPLLGHLPIEVLPNGLDTAVFRPFPKATARQQFGLPNNRWIVTYGAINAMRDARKGFRELLGALELLGRHPGAEKILLVVFGDLQPGDIPETGIEIRHVGYINDDERLTRLYASSDVAVMPSLQEAFGKTLIEAMACGTPVVAFDHGGPRDIISHCVDGYLARPFRPDDLAQGILWCLEQIASGNDLGAAARAKVEAEFDIEVVAARYHELYTRILSPARRTANDQPAAGPHQTHEYMPSFDLGNIGICSIIGQGLAFGLGLLPLIA